MAAKKTSKTSAGSGDEASDARISSAMAEHLTRYGERFVNVYGHLPVSADIAHLWLSAFRTADDAWVEGLDGVHLDALVTKAKPSASTQGPEPDVIFGDLDFDLAKDFLMEIARVIGGKKAVALDDFLAVLGRGLERAGPGRLLDVTPESRVVVSAKTSKKPKKQRWSVGDILAIPIRERAFAIGRILFASKKAFVLEIFREIRKTPTFTRETLASGRLIAPVDPTLGGARFIEEWRWPILAHDTGFVLSAEARDALVFKFDPSSPGELVDVEGYKKRALTEHERSHTFGKSWSAEDLELKLSRVMARLDAGLSPEPEEGDVDPWRWHKERTLAEKAARQGR